LGHCVAQESYDQEEQESVRSVVFVELDVIYQGVGYQHVPDS
jgi:hypothetical protein